MIEQIRSYYIPKRTELVDSDFLEFEEEMSSEIDQDLIVKLLALREKSTNFVEFPNPHNSILLYVTGLTSQFSQERSRADTIGGSPPDIDIDFDALERYKAINWVINSWGREQVAAIITHGKFKPKSVVKDWYRVTEGSNEDKARLLKAIPPAIFGKEPTLDELVYGDLDKGDDSKGYMPNPWIVEETDKFEEWLASARKLENMVKTFGVHAAGIVISNEPISNIVPIWAKGEKEMQSNGMNKKVQRWITQYDMGEVEELGLIKFDFLSIDNLSVMKECARLIKESYGISIDPYAIPDGDKRTYKMLHQGLLTGIFQMETGGVAESLIRRIKPMNVEEVSDISALNRPGPLAAGLDQQYIDNKNNGYAPHDLPPAVAEILSGTYWTLVYQEQVMRITSELAGFTLRESDDIRRAMGKKKKKVLAGYEVPFVKGCIEKGLTEDFARKLWKTLLGFADYCFNKSHSIAYSMITYICAWMKANYPVEFFAALMSVRSQSMQPKDWAQKAPEYVNEAKLLDVHIHSPSVNASGLSFTIQKNEVYFGLSAIRNCGKTASRCITGARGKTKFTDVENFVTRVNTTKVNTKVFQALVHAGAFDRLGYNRQELIEKTQEIYDYVKSLVAHAEREQEIIVRTTEIAAILPLIEERDELRIKLKASLRKRNPGKELTEEESQRLEFLNDSGLKRKIVLKSKEKSEFPELQRTKRIKISVVQLMKQAEYIGCYIGQHPVPIVFPSRTRLAQLELGHKDKAAGIISSIKVIVDKNGRKMAFMEIGDGSAIAEVIIFASTFAKFDKPPEPGEMVDVFGKVDSTDPIKLIAFSIKVHRSTYGET
jgi:DNA-directed DNA polymerase III PolC